MILFAFSSTRLESTMPASSIVSRNSSICATCAVWMRLERSAAALVVTIALATSGKVVGAALVAWPASRPTGPCQRRNCPSVPTSSGAAGVPVRIAA